MGEEVDQFLDDKLQVKLDVLFFYHYIRCETVQYKGFDGRMVKVM